MLPLVHLSYLTDKSKFENFSQKRLIEGDHGADITEGITHRGDVVHPLGGGDFRQHGVIEHDAGMEAHLRQDEDSQEEQPVGGNTQGGAGDTAQYHSQQEYGLLELQVRHRAADGGDDGDQNGGDGAGIAPVA